MLSSEHIYTYKKEEELTKPYEFTEFYHIVAYPARLSYELGLNWEQVDLNQQL